MVDKDQKINSPVMIAPIAIGVSRTTQESQVVRFGFFLVYVLPLIIVAENGKIIFNCCRRS